MRNFVKVTLGSILCLTSLSSFAIIDYYNAYNRSANESGESISKYLLNLGAYLGYDLARSPASSGQTISVELINAPQSQIFQTYLLYGVLGAIPVTAINKAISEFAPSKSATGNLLNPFANFTFKGQKYNTPSTDGGKVSVSPLIDQKTYQQDPVSQGVLNILTTPDQSFCMSYDEKTWNGNCQLLFQNKVTSNAIGTLPPTNTFFSFDYVNQFLGQLNSNTLLSPMLYSTELAQDSSSSGNNEQNKGLQAKSQAQQALNFIRYVSGSLLLPELPKMRDYDNLYMQATSVDTSVPMATRVDSYNRLTRYLTSLRTHAAQMSVGLSNLYYIMSKRLPQNEDSQNTKPISQALSEFNLATWRLYNPDLSSNQQWINRINTASPATVQKEIAVLLAEMSYQMYLSRQQDERLLLTQTLLLLQTTHANQPSADFFSQGSTTAAPQ